MSVIFILFILCVGIVVGAYSHKWLAKVTGAPSNVTADGVVAVVKADAADVAKKL